MRQNEISTKIIETVQQHRVESDACDLVVSFEVRFDALKRTRGCTTRHASSGQIKHEVQPVFAHVARRGLNAAAMPVECGPDRTKASQQGRDKMRRSNGLPQGEVAKALLLFGVERRLETFLGLFFDGRLGLSSVHCYQIFLLHDQRSFGLPLKARTKWVC